MAPDDRSASRPTAPRELSHAELATAVAAADRQFYRLCALSPDAAIHSTPELTWFSLGTQVAVETVVVHSDWVRPGAERAVAQTVGGFRRARQPFLWTVHAASRPAGLGRLLVSHGLTPIAQHAGMSLDLGRSGTRAGTPVHPGVEVAEVRTEEQLAQYADIVTEVFGSPGSWHRTLRAAHAALGLGLGATSPWQLLVGALDGRPVGSACVTRCAETAAVHNLGVLPAARKRGVGAALAAEACGVAGRWGRRYVVLTATPQGYAMYRALGFTDCGSVTIYAFEGAKQVPMRPGL